MSAITAISDPITTTSHLGDRSLATYPVCKNPITEAALDHKTGNPLVKFIDGYPEVRNPFAQLVNKRLTKAEQDFLNLFKSKPTDKKYSNFRILPSRSHTKKHEVTAIITKQIEASKDPKYLREMLSHFANSYGIINFVFEDPKKVLTYRLDKNDILPVVVTGYRLIDKQFADEFAQVFPKEKVPPGDAARRILAFANAGTMDRNGQTMTALFKPEEVRVVGPDEFDWLIEQLDRKRRTPIFSLDGDNTSPRVEKNGHYDTADGQSLRFLGLRRETNADAVYLAKQATFTSIEKEEIDGRPEIIKLHDPEAYEVALGGKHEVLSAADCLASQTHAVCDAYGEVATGIDPKEVLKSQ